MKLLDVRTKRNQYIIILTEEGMKYRVTYYHDHLGFMFEKKTLIDPMWRTYSPDDPRPFKSIAYWVSGEWK